jgi:hypothetical protein
VTIFFLKIWRLLHTETKCLGTQFFTLGSSLCRHKGNQGHVTLWSCHLYIKKYVKKAKEEELLWKLKYFTHAKLYYSSKNTLKETQILQDIF